MELTTASLRHNLIAICATNTPFRKIFLDGNIVRNDIILGPSVGRMEEEKHTGNSSPQRTSSFSTVLSGALSTHSSMSSVSRDNHDNEDWLNGNNNLLSKENRYPGKWNRSSSTDSGSMKSSGSGKMGRRGSNSRQRAITIRRQSVHQDMTEHASISVRNIRRQFYGLEVDHKVIDKAKSFFEHWRDTFTATVIVFLYFLIGLIFYKNVEGGIV